MYFGLESRERTGAVVQLIKWLSELTYERKHQIAGGSVF